MDKDTLRIVLLAVGLLVIVGIYIWGRYKEKLIDFLQRRGEYDELGFDPSADEASPAYQEPEEDEYENLGFKGKKPEPAKPRAAPAYSFEEDEDGEPLFADPEPPSAKPAPEPAASKARPEPEARKARGLGAPILIQISVVATGGRFFPGDELRDALLELDLIHGSMGIFHRYDRKFRESLFSVASMVEPGTFPMDDMESFESPGLVLFFQPDQVSNPIAVYDDLMRTCHKLANRLGGQEWDERRQPLTREKVAQMRAQLEDACEES